MLDRIHACRFTLPPAEGHHGNTVEVRAKMDLCSTSDELLKLASQTLSDHGGQLMACHLSYASRCQKQFHALSCPYVPLFVAEAGRPCSQCQN